MNKLDEDTSDGSKNEQPAAKPSKVKYLLLKGGVKIGRFNSFYEAYQYGLSHLNNGFLVHKSMDQ